MLLRCLSLKMILGPLILAVIGVISVKYYPQGSYQDLTVRFRNAYVTRKVAELFICADLGPDECKNATDEVLKIVSLIPQDLWTRAAEFFRERSTLSGTVQTNHNEAKKGAVDFTQGRVEVKGNEEKAEQIIKSLKFAKYDESNLCDLKEGIPHSEYDATVDEIADLTNMPEKLKRTIKRAKSFTGGNVLAVNRLQFKAADGNLVFGRVAVIRRGKVLDMAYSLHSVEYELMPKQRQPDQADKLQQFSGSLGQEDNATFDGISTELRKNFLAFFHKEAINGFIKHCDYVLKTITHSDDVKRAIVETPIMIVNNFSFSIIMFGSLVLCSEV